MRMGKTKISRTDWKLWFAWYPVRITETYKLTWLKNVGKRLCTRETELTDTGGWCFVDKEKEYCTKVNMFFDKLK